MTKLLGSHRSPESHIIPGGHSNPQTLRAGDLELDEERWTVHRAGTEVSLSPTEFRLLAYLMRNQGQVIPRARLLADVWGWSGNGESQIVETYVSYLRRKLDALGPRVIHTQRGVGYLLRPHPVCQGDGTSGLP